MEKGNKSQMPTDIHQHMAHATEQALCVCVFVCVFAHSSRAQKIQVWLKWFSSGDSTSKSGWYVYNTIEFALRPKTGLRGRATHTHLKILAAHNKKYHVFLIVYSAAYNFVPGFRVFFPQYLSGKENIVAKTDITNFILEE